MASVRHCKILLCSLNHLIKLKPCGFRLQGFLIFRKLAYNTIIYVWGNAQISDNKYSQLTRIIQSYWHNHFHVRSHTCQTQKKNEIPCDFSWTSCTEELPESKWKPFSVLFNSWEPYSLGHWTFPQDAGLSSCAVDTVLPYRLVNETWLCSVFLEPPARLFINTQKHL